MLVRGPGGDAGAARFGGELRGRANDSRRA